MVGIYWARVGPLSRVAVALSDVTDSRKWHEVIQSLSVQTCFPSVDRDRSWETGLGSHSW